MAESYPTDQKEKMVTKTDPEQNRDAVKKCLTQIKLYEREFETWTKEVKDISKRYRAEKNATNDYRYDEACQFNLFWANVQLQLPTLYARTPIAQIERRSKNDELIPRVASELWERATRFQIDAYDFDATPTAAVLDLLLGSRGVARIRYNPEFNINPDTGEKELQSQNVYCEYVNFEDFQHNSARTWEEVTEIRFKNYFSKAEAKQRFPKHYKELQYTHVPALVEKDDKLAPLDDQSEFKKAIVWEIWDKTTRTVKWVSKDYAEDYLDVIDDPLGLKGFFPVPKPLYGTLTNDTLIPVPDARQTKKLYDQLDQIQGKIDRLTTDLKTAGVYPAHHPEVARLYQSNERLIPVRDWAGLQRDGSLGEIMQFLPVGHVVEALTILYQQKEQLKQDIYEISGISDLMRGSTNPNETAAAQQLKGQFGSIRIGRYQNEVQRFCRDLIALTAEIIAEHFSEEMLMKMTGTDFIKIPRSMLPPPLPPMPEQSQSMNLQQSQGINSPPPSMPQSYAGASPQGGAMSMEGQAEPSMEQGMGAQMPMEGMPPSGGPAPMESPMQSQGMGPMSPPPAPPPIDPEQLKQDIYMQAVEFLRDDPMRRFRIDIETDSTLAINEIADRQDKSEMLQSVTGFLGQLTQITQTMPDALPLCGEMLLTVTRAFRSGRNLEGSIEEFIDAAKEKVESMKNQPPPPNPRQIEIEGKMQLEQMKLEHQMRLEQMKMEYDIQLSGTKVELERAKADIKSYTELEELRNAILLEREKLAAEVAVQREQMSADIRLKAVTAELDARIKAEKHALDRIDLLQNQPPRKTIVTMTGKDELGNRNFEIERVEELPNDSIGVI